MRSSLARFWTGTLLVLAFGGTALSQSVSLHAKWTVGPDPTKFKQGSFNAQKVMLMIYASDAKGADNMQGIFDKNSAAARDKRFWKVIATDKKNKEQEVSFQLIAPINSSGKLPYILLYLDKQPSEELSYRVEIAGEKPQSIIASPFHITNLDKFPKEIVNNTHLKDDIRYADGNKALEPKVEFKIGKDSTASLKLFYGYEAWKNENKLRFESSLDAEGSWQPKGGGHVLGKIDGELGLLYLATDVPPGGRFLHALWESGVNARIESDQTFDNVNQTVGWANFLAVNGDFVQWFSNFSVGTPTGYSEPSPLFTINYEFVNTLTQDPGTDMRRSETKTDRLRVHIYWSHRLVHDLDLTSVSTKLGRYTVDFVVDSGIAYDFRNSTTLPDINLALEIAPLSLDKSKPSLTVSYVNGKTKATFENYNAILAGIKLPF